MYVNLFKGELHIAFIVIVVHIIPPIVHGQEINKAYTGITLFMLGVMLKQNRQLEQLVQFGYISCQQHKQYVYASPFQWP